MKAGSVKVTQGSRKGRGLRVGVVWSRFHEDVTKRLLEGALRGLADCGVSKRHISVVSVPGAFEIPTAVGWLAGSGSVDALVAVGAVIRGETDHYSFVASAAQQGALEVALSTGIPVTFGVLTTHTLDQALMRAGEDSTNKGYEAAVDAVEMANLHKELS